MNSPEILDTSVKAPEKQLLTQWNRYGKSVIGRKLFNYMLGRKVPYSGSIKPQIISINSGSASLLVRDRCFLRNHLNSIHAIALANMGELASGLAMLSALPAKTRAIVIKLEIEYLKKARGNLLVEGIANPPEVIDHPMDSIAIAHIKDNSGDTVSSVKVLWRLSPKESKAKPNQEARNE